MGERERGVEGMGMREEPVKTVSYVAVCACVEHDERVLSMRGLQRYCKRIIDVV